MNLTSFLKNRHHYQHQLYHLNELSFLSNQASITLQPMTLVIQILVETARRALKTIITPEIIIARVQEDTRVKTVITMSVSESVEVYCQIM